MAFCADGLEFLSASVEDFLHFVPDEECVVGVCSEVFDGIAVCVASQRCAVCPAVALVAAAVGLQCSLAHDAVAYDEGGLAADFLCGIKCLAYFCYVVAVYAEDFPSQCAVLGGCVLVGYYACLCGELYVVGVIEHYQIVQSQCACYACCAL